MSRAYSLVVIGASSAGIMHAIAAARNGVEVLLLEDQADPDQQSIQDLRDSGVKYLSGHSVWYLDRHREIGVLSQAGKLRLRAERIIIASAAQERTMPFPGWELPGVMTAIEAQALLKTRATFSEKAVVLVGHGPLLWLLASRLIDVGAPITAVLEITGPGASFVTGKVHAEIPCYRIQNLRACGDTKLQSVAFEQDGKLERLETTTLITHNGLIPDIRLAQAAGCAIDWNQQGQYWQVRVDPSGESSQSGIFVADDATYDSVGVEFPLDDETVICRCESVRLGELKAVIAMGCTGPNQAKAFIRCGMGNCQGRACAAIVEQAFTRQLGKPMDEIGHFRARPPLKPITLGQLAGTAETES